MSDEDDAMAGADVGPDENLQVNDGDPLPPDVGPDDPMPDADETEVVL